jgi:hypothetical protein
MKRSAPALQHIVARLPDLSDDVIVDFCGARNMTKVRHYIGDSVHAVRQVISVYHLTLEARVGSMSSDHFSHLVTIDFDEQGPINASCSACKHG